MGLTAEAVAQQFKVSREDQDVFAYNSHMKALKAQEILEGYKIAANVWSVSSYQQLHKNALEVERVNMLQPNKKPKESYLYTQLKGEKGVFVAVSDYMKLLPDSLSRHAPKEIYSLGTDGFGRSEAREELREFFEIDARFITLAVVNQLYKNDEVGKELVLKVISDLKINTGKLNPYEA